MDPLVSRVSGHYPNVRGQRPPAGPQDRQLPHPRSADHAGLQHRLGGVTRQRRGRVTQLARNRRASAELLNPPQPWGPGRTCLTRQ